MKQKASILSSESDGTRQLMALAPAIEQVLACGWVLLVDELENQIHPLLMQLIVSKFQSFHSNPNHAQLIFTTQSTEFKKAVAPYFVPRLFRAHRGCDI